MPKSLKKLSNFLKKCFGVVSDNVLESPVNETINWTNIQYFEPNENWGNISKLDVNLVYGLDRLRKICGLPIHIHCAVDERPDNPTSYHPRGMAADIHIERMSLLSQFLWAIKVRRFGGIGLYPDWNNPGLHIDTRQDCRRGFWIQKDGKYIELSTNNIKKYILGV